MSASLAIEEVQQLLSKAPCPSCGKRDLEFILRCDTGERSCSYEAVCPACDASFSVSPEKPTGALEALLPFLHCPECGRVGAEFSFRCELPTHVCVEIVACRGCGHPYAGG